MTACRTTHVHEDAISDGRHTAETDIETFDEYCWSSKCPTDVSACARRYDLQAIRSAVGLVAGNADGRASDGVDDPRAVGG